jgi:OmpA family protein
MEEGSMRIVKPTRRAALVSLAWALAVTQPASAQLYVYPEKGQSAQQQQKDQGECHGWAMQQSGYNPRAPQPAPPPPPSTAPQGQVARGAARGATVGVVGGAIAGDPGKGAAIGAASGALIGGMRRRDEQRAQQQQYEQATAQQQAMQAQGNDAYNRALAACLSGRGYTVR